MEERDTPEVGKCSFIGKQAVGGKPAQTEMSMHNKTLAKEDFTKEHTFQASKPFSSMSL